MVFERFESNRRPVPDRTGEPPPVRAAAGEDKEKPRRAGLHLGLEEAMLLCACVVAVAAVSFFLGRYTRGKTAATRPEQNSARERVEGWRLEDLQRAFEPAPVRYGLSAGVYATEREARARASSFAAKGLRARVLEGKDGFTTTVGEFADPSQARLSPLSQETPDARPVRLP